MMETKNQRPMRPIPSIQDIAKIINATSNARDRAIILTLSKTGIKVNELINLNVDNVSWENRSISTPMVMRNEQRKVYFDDECEAALKLWLTERVSDKGNAAICKFSW